MVEMALLFQPLKASSNLDPVQTENPWASHVKQEQLENES